MQCASVHLPTYTTDLVNTLPLCFYHFLLLSHHSAWQCNICKWNKLNLRLSNGPITTKISNEWIQQIQKWDSTGRPINFRKGRGKTRETWSTNKGEYAKKMRNVINEDKKTKQTAIYTSILYEQFRSMLLFSLWHLNLFTNRPPCTSFHMWINHVFSSILTYNPKAFLEPPTYILSWNLLYFSCS